MIFRSVLLPALCAALCASAAHADRFHLGPADRAEQMTAGEPDIVEGVLLREEDGRYVIRVVGGEIQIAKALVREIERDDLTVEEIERREQAARGSLAEANAERESRQALAQAERMERIREVRAAEASARRTAAQPAEASVPPLPRQAYDPVLGIVRPVPNGPDAFVVNRLIQSELGGEMRRALQRQRRR
ncbi:MAG: hypothetical protein IPM29_05345 [Planctomycetes bacterium]|nr:hypothetical protein [Planctomycetota bacterium]